MPAFNTKFSIHVVHPDGAVEGSGVKAARHSGREGHPGGVSLWLRGTGRAERRGRRRHPAREEALDGVHQGIEG